MHAPPLGVVLSRVGQCLWGRCLAWVYVSVSWGYCNELPHTSRNGFFPFQNQRSEPSVMAVCIGENLSSPVPYSRAASARHVSWPLCLVLWARHISSVSLLQGHKWLSQLPPEPSETTLLSPLPRTSFYLYKATLTGSRIWDMNICEGHFFSCTFEYTVSVQKCHMMLEEAFLT